MNSIKNPDFQHELDFWRGFIKTPRFLNEWLPGDVVPSDLTHQARELLAEIVGPDSTVLDMGSGVVSILRGTVKDEQLVAADPLAKEYRKIFDYEAHGITPPISLAAEDMIDVDKFDVVHISNAIDHTVNPVIAYNKLKQAVKPGGYLVVQGFVNEGTFEKFKGLHQWDLSINYDGHLSISNSQGGGVVIGIDRHHSDIFKLSTGKTWMIWVARKP